MSTLTFEKNYPGYSDNTKQRTKIYNRLRTGLWLKAILVGVCGGLFFLVADVVLKGLQGPL